MFKTKLFFLLLLYSFCVYSQQEVIVDATFLPEKNIISVSEKIVFTNSSKKTIDSIYLHDWNNSFSSTKTPLAKRFSEEYRSIFHFSKTHERGKTVITDITDNTQKILYNRPQPDIIALKLNKPLNSQNSVTIHLSYTLQLPATKFTGFGITPNKNIALKEWFIIPAVLTDHWKVYSNKNLDDLYAPKSNLSVSINVPKAYSIYSDLDKENQYSKNGIRTITFKGTNRVSSEFHITKEESFKTTITDKLTYVSNCKSKNISPEIESVIYDKVSQFLTKHIGEYPHKKILLSNENYKQNPVYGLNQLPSFIRPFPSGFQQELKILKTTISKYLKNTILTNPRTDYWLSDALETYIMIKYLDQNYPEMKILGSLSSIWGIKTLEISKKKFNDQYSYFSLYTARKNLAQKLNTAKDSLLKYNATISNKNKAGIGLLYLEDYLNKNILSEAIKEYYLLTILKKSNSADFITYLQTKTDKDLSWFMEEYVLKDYKIDYTIKKVIKHNNELLVHLKNNEKSIAPISIYQIKGDKIIHKEYVTGFANTKTIVLPNKSADKVVLNYEGIVPEYNLRNNSKPITPHLLNKPLQFNFLKDAEAPLYNQIFYVPQLGYNLYDGFTPGIRFTNKTILEKPFLYSIKPLYGTKSKKLIGSTSLLYTKHYKNKSIFSAKYGLSFQQYHYLDDLMYTRFNPFMVFLFRPKNNLRSNHRERIVLRNISVHRSQNTTSTDTPNYNVTNLNYINTSKTHNQFYAFIGDLQYAKNFSKVSATFEYRNNYKDNRQFNIRVFTGAFLKNKTQHNYFSFAVDRPTDYMFDHNYYGRSEDTGFYSQQIIIAEGGFKSKLDTPFANNWIATLNIDTTIWKYIYAYADIGILSNNNTKHLLFDSGIHLNLVPDYLELYFPISSNLGLEINQSHYNEKIRFKATLSTKTLIQLFNREWL